MKVQRTSSDQYRFQPEDVGCYPVDRLWWLGFEALPTFGPKKLLFHLWMSRRWWSSRTLLCHLWDGFADSALECLLRDAACGTPLRVLAVCSVGPQVASG